MDEIVMDALEWIELVASDDEVKRDLEVICTRCAGHLCDAEAGDTLRVLVSTALAHICEIPGKAAS